VFVQVIVNRPTHYRPPLGSDPVRDDTSHMATFTYRLPERLRDMISVGHLVQVPLGASAAQGIVVALADEPPDDLPAGIEIRELTECLDPLPVVTQTQIDLARWVASEYLAPLNQSIRLMLPPGLEARTFFLVSQAAHSVRPDHLTSQESAVLRLLQQRGGRIRADLLLDQISDDDPEAVLHAMAERGLVDAGYTLVPPKPAPPRVQYVRLLADDVTIETSLPRLGRASKQADALWILSNRAVSSLGENGSGAPQPLAAIVTLAELCDLAGCTEGPVRALAARGWVEIAERQTLVVALPGAREAELGRAYKQAEALASLLDRGGPVELEAFLAETGHSRSIISALEKKGLVQRVVQAPVVLLALQPEKVLDRVIELRGAEKERAVLEMLKGSVDRIWVGGIYAQTGANLGTLHKLADRGLVSLHAAEFERPQPVGPEAPPRLTPDQAAAWQVIERGMQEQANDGYQSFVALLHGVTGSGKTELYLRAVQATLAAGRRAIVLVPEISLTPQTVRRFEARFPGRVAVMHSQLSLGQRYAVWDRVRRGDADVVIGPRLALFAPISRLGLIVLDEAHDGSYKQSEPIPLPAYHARDVAIELGRLAGAAVLLGTATPSLETYFRARQGAYHLLELPHRIMPLQAGTSDPASVGHPTKVASLPPVRIVDLRQELRAGNRSILSRALQEALRQTLDAGEQAIIFLNRRGAATFVLCRDCGHVVLCPRCDLPLTFHRAIRPARGSSSEQASQPGTMVCHHCNWRESSPSNCPSCGSSRIRYFGLGTERVEETLHQLFPQARLLRWDRDTATGFDHDRFLQAFIDHRADLLVGTQMIAKGLDLPLVTLVGVASADTALNLPDFRAAERTFQLLTQVAGRAGRSHRGGRVIVQTYNPEHYAIQAAARHDYAAFYERELAYRRRLAYPPFSRLVALRFSHRDPRRCQAEASRIGRWLESEIRLQDLAVELIGPAPCFFSRIQGRYRWQIVIRAPDPVVLLRDVALPWGWSVDVDPITLL
jgi:primosomal protein N' (replication factor Y)